MSQLCSEIHQLFNQLNRFSFPFDKRDISDNGIYILFEKGESGHGKDRIVRVGTHTGERQLRSRLKQHFIRENKDRSIFRKNIGRAILNHRSDPFLQQWNLDLTTSEAKDKYKAIVDFDKQKGVEKEVTEYIQNSFSFNVFRVDDKEERLGLESKIISTVSLCTDCFPSDNWLGLYSPKQKIRQSGLWLVNELYKVQLSNDGVEEMRILLG